MTRKLSDLREFMQYLARQGYTSTIGDISMRQCIAEHFGISEYVQISILKSLVRFGFAKPDPQGFWQLFFPARKGMRAFYDEMEVRT